MNPTAHRDADPQPGSATRKRWVWLLMAVCAAVVLIGLFRIPNRHQPGRNGNSDGRTGIGANTYPPNHSGPARSFPQRLHPSQPPTAEEIVANKVTQFGRSRREIARAIARRSQKELPPYVEKFFDAVESGRWEDIDREWRELSKHSGQYDSSTEDWEELNPYWSAVLDAYGVAEQAHLWPAQELLDYGKAILDSLRPGTVYVGGTDCGRWIPELLNDTSEGDHTIVTQNALADGRYQDWITTLYSDRMKTLTPEESQRAFQEYTDDATKRFQHDQQFPDEPKQVRPGEDIKFVDGRIQVSGQIAVMGINERLLQMLMEKNPDLTFAIQESFSLPGTYANAVPLGPIMELNAPNTFTAERAAQSLEVWQNRAEQYLTGGATPSAHALAEYSHDAAAAANLLAAHNFLAEAEQVYRVATQLGPKNAGATAALANVLAQTGRENESRQLLADFTRQYPNEVKELERARASWRVTITAKTSSP